MRILILSWRGPGHPKAGGAEQVTHEHAKAWVEAGYSVSLFTSAYRGCTKNTSIDGVEIIRRGNEILTVQLSAFFWYLFSRHEKFDLVIDHFHGIPFFTPLYIRIIKVAFIHEVAKEVWKLNPWPAPFKYIPYYLGPLFEKLIVKFIYRNISFMTVSDSTRFDLIKIGIDKNDIKVIYKTF